MRILKMLVSSLALLLSVTVVLLGCDGDKGTGGSGGGTNTGGSSGNKCGVDGTAKSCKTVKIGEQTWMAENLNYQTGNSKCYGDADSNCVKYGRLYDWKTAVNACPNGWKLPDTTDWYMLIDEAGGFSTAGTKLKSSSGWSWNSYIFEGNLIVGTDDYGFSALPGSGNGWQGKWWTSTDEYSYSNAYSLEMNSNIENVWRQTSNVGSMFSVRCIKN
jgi:uncharacterized protein (TIGR02145 family)